MNRGLRGRVVGVSLLVLAVGSACNHNPPAPVVTTPKFPNYPTPDVPPALRVSEDVRNRHGVGWLRLQAGDLSGANRDFSAVLKLQPDFYPSETGLGFVSLANRQFKSAVTYFTAALAKNDRYLPAWLGQAEAELGMNNDREGIAAMEQVITIDPKRETAMRSRIELVRLRDVQAFLDLGRRQRASGKFEDSKKSMQQALDLSPTTTIILREFALTDTASGSLDDAETHARKAVELEPEDTENQVALSTVLEARGKYRDAAAALAKAVALDPRPEWKTHVAALKDKADFAALPSDFGNLASATMITRADVAAFIGIKLRTLVDKAPRRGAPVVTDVRTHWAAPWIVPITQAGIMEVYANHTFQPSATVRRGDLAEISSQLVAIAAAGRPADVARWRAARPKFPDVPSTNLFYRAAAMAVSSGAMAADADGRFQPTRPATGAELSAVVTHVDLLATH